MSTNWHQLALTAAATAILLQAPGSLSGAQAAPLDFFRQIIGCGDGHNATLPRCKLTDIGKAASPRTDPALIPGVDDSPYFHVLLGPTDVPTTGYTRIDYSFTNSATDNPADGITWQDQAQNKSTFAQAILAWAARLISTKDDTYIVVLSASDTTGRVFWTRPLLSFQYHAGFTSITNINSISLTGSSTYWRPISDEMTVSLELKHTNSTSISSTLITDIFAAATGLSAALDVKNAVTGLFSKVNDVLSNDAYKSKFDKLTQDLAKFETIDDATYSATLSYAHRLQPTSTGIGISTAQPAPPAEVAVSPDQPNPIGFVYHFFSKTTSLPTFVLTVNLEYKDALFATTLRPKQGGSGSIVQQTAVMSLPVLAPGESSGKSLELYLRDGEGTTHVLEDLATVTRPGKDVEKACDKIAAALGRILEPDDVAIGLAAYILQNRGAFSGLETPSCFNLNGFDVLLALHQVEVPAGFAAGSAPASSDKVRSIFDDGKSAVALINQYLGAFGDIGKYGAGDQQQSDVTVIVRQGRADSGPQAITVIDTMGLLFPDAKGEAEGYMTFPLEMAKALGRTPTKFAGFGCYWPVHATATDPNVDTMGVQVGDSLFDITISFEAMPPANLTADRLRVVRVEVSPMNDATLSALKQHNSECPFKLPTSAPNTGA